MKSFKDLVNDYFLIILIFIAGGIVLVFEYFKFDRRITLIIALLSLYFNAIRDLRTKHKEDIDDATSKLTDKKIDEIDNFVTKKNRELEDKQKIMSNFLRWGVIKSEDIIKNLNTRSFLIIYHFNSAAADELEPYFPDNKKKIYKLIESLGFVPVGAYTGSYFFHIRCTDDLPVMFNDINYVEAYLRKKITEYWNEMWLKLEKNNKELYAKYEKQEEKDRAVNIIYLLGRVFPSNMSVGYLNFSSFNIRFSEYYSRFVDLKTINMDTEKLNHILSLASLELFIDSIEPKDRIKICEKETTIKTELGIKSLIEYDKIKEEQWVQVLSKIVLFDNEKAGNYAKLITISTKKYCPIIKEFL